jgi:hypothetical protein
MNRVGGGLAGLGSAMQTAVTAAAASVQDIGLEQRHRVHRQPEFPLAGRRPVGGEQRAPADDERARRIHSPRVQHVHVPGPQVSLEVG